MKTQEAKHIQIIAIVGTTASGKSDLAVEIARKVDGEVVSADSRQVYKGLDIGTGKITKKEMRGIPHHLLDVTDPKKVYTVADYQKDATEAILDIVKRDKVPVVCGGTGFYIDAVLKGIIFPDVPPNPTLRANLEKKSLSTLLKMLAKLDPERLKTIDVNNPRRIIRAIEIAKAPKKRAAPNISIPSYSILSIGLAPEDDLLKKRIALRLKKRFKTSMLDEAISLHKKGMSWKRMEALGLEYRYMARFLKLQHRLVSTKNTKGLVHAHVEMVSNLEMEIWHYAKRQRTWFKRDKEIVWNPKNPIAVVQNFLKKRPKMLG